MIFETIVTTQDIAAKLHIAPIGVHRRDEFHIIAPFRPSATLANIEATGRAVINYTDDVRIFAGCLTGRYDWPTVAAEKIAGVRLAASLAHCEVELTAIEDDPLRPRLLCRAVHSINHAPFRGFNRAQAAVIEAAILVSRLHMLPSEKVKSEIAYLTIALDKTAGANEREAWGWLMEKIATHFASVREHADEGHS